MGKSNSSSAVRKPKAEEGGRAGGVWWYLASVEQRFGSHGEARSFLATGYCIETDEPLTEIPVGGAEVFEGDDDEEDHIIARASDHVYIVLYGRPIELFTTIEQAYQRGAALDKQWKKSLARHNARYGVKHKYEPVEWKLMGITAPRAEEMH